MDMELTKTVTEDLANPRLSALLKEKGFDWPCREYYAHNGRLGRRYTRLMRSEGLTRNTENAAAGFMCTAPTLSYAEKWLRDEHGISIDVITDWEWTRDPMAAPNGEKRERLSEFAGYFFEVHRLKPHEILYDSAVISEDHAETEAEAIRTALGFIGEVKRT